MFVFLCSCSTPPKVPFTHLKNWKGYSVPGYYYTVQRGDTLESIATLFGCDLDLLSEINELPRNQTLGAGQRLFIPRSRTEYPHYYYSKPRQSDPLVIPPSGGAYADSSLERAIAALIRSGQAPQGPTVVMAPTPKPLPPPPAQPPTPTVFKVPPGSGSRPMGGAEAMMQPPPVSRATMLPTFPQADPPQIPMANRQKGIAIAQSYTKHPVPYSPPTVISGAPAFQWPAGGTITSVFNLSGSGKRLHNGIDIANKRGTPIRAAAAGRVLYSDSKYLPSMGNMILIEHSGGWITLYAHNDRNLVKEGDSVQAGQIIAMMGMTGNSTGPHLHFEIRRNADTPVDPQLYLPKAR
ncbi:MAG: LysM peptidoglycan-binding domain-containing M23 family metallopeptidase [Candidatus Sumerlaeia bacterium]|nr:LysM peptidoglycan-binding domain-containing M23 family metallopeptidase [Candidatus Sumerlaeia bacterium]